MLDPDTIACARIVEAGDPLRFRTVMASPLEARRVLFPLYAFNVEVSRAPWVTQEPMIAEMRLQWWRDALEEIREHRDVRKHEVTTPLSCLITPADAAELDALVAARRWDCHKEAFEDVEHFDAYIDRTSGHLMCCAARALGAHDESTTRALAYGAGVAAFLRAIPKLEASGRIPLLDGTHEGLRALARRALDRMGRVRTVRNPALWPAIGASATLRQVLRAPGDVSKGLLDPGLNAWRLSKAALLKRL